MSNKTDSYGTIKKVIENGIEYETCLLPNGNKYWSYKGKYHRENGPAMEISSGFRCWCKYGKYHREDGPAIIHIDGTKDYCLNGIYYSDISSDDEWLIKQIIE